MIKSDPELSNKIQSIGYVRQKETHTNSAKSNDHTPGDGPSSSNASQDSRGRERKRVGYLREGLALRPDTAVVSDDGGGREGMPVAHIAHQVLVDVGLPRHLRFFFFLSLSPSRALSLSLSRRFRMEDPSLLYAPVWGCGEGDSVGTPRCCEMTKMDRVSSVLPIVTAPRFVVYRELRFYLLSI